MKFKNLTKICFLVLILSLFLTGATRADDLLSYIPDSEEEIQKRYVCDLVENELQVCFQRKTPIDGSKKLDTPSVFSQPFENVLKMAVKNLKEDTAINPNFGTKTTASCLSALSVNEGNMYKILNEFFFTKERIRNRQIYFSNFDTSKASANDDVKDQLTYSHYRLFGILQRNPSVHMHSHIGIQTAKLDSLKSGLSTSVRYWAALIAIGILQNAGVREQLMNLTDSPVTRAAQCVLFEGNVPSEFAISSVQEIKP